MARLNCVVRGVGKSPFRDGAAPEGRGQAVQGGRERDGRDLEDAADRGRNLPTARCARVARRPGERRGLHQRSTCCEPRRQEDAARHLGAGERLLKRAHDATAFLAMSVSFERPRKCRSLKRVPVGDPLDAVPGDAAALRDALDNARPQRGSSCLSPGQSSRNTRAVTPPSGSSSGNRMETSSLSPNGLSMMARSGAVPKCTGRSSPGSPKPI